jgi:hypothetical protein
VPAAAAAAAHAGDTTVAWKRQLFACGTKHSMQGMQKSTGHFQSPFYETHLWSYQYLFSTALRLGVCCVLLLPVRCLFKLLLLLLLLVLKVSPIHDLITCMGIILQMSYPYRIRHAWLSGLAWQQCTRTTLLSWTLYNSGTWLIHWWVHTFLLHMAYTHHFQMLRTSLSGSSGTWSVHCTASRFHWGMACTMSPPRTSQTSRVGTSGTLSIRLLKSSCQVRTSSTALHLSGREVSQRRTVA